MDTLTGAGHTAREVEDVTVQVAGGEQLWQLTVEHSPVGTTLVAPDGRLLLLYYDRSTGAPLTLVENWMARAGRP